MGTAGAEQGFDVVGPTPERRRSTARRAKQLINLLLGCTRFGWKGAAAKRARGEVGQFLSEGAAECCSSLEASFEATNEHCRCGLQRLLHDSVPGTLRGLRRIERSGFGVCDALVHDDLVGAQEHLALLMIGVEQAAMDSGRWELAYRLMLLEEAASQLWSYRNTSFDPKLKAFSPLCPQRWTTIALAYSKEIDYIQAKRAEVAVPKLSAVPGQPQPSQPNAQPKKRNRFPKAKAAPAQEGQAS